MKINKTRFVSSLLGLGMLLAITSLGAYSEDTLALSEIVYGCNLEPHTHSEACYNRELTCPLEESEEHTHGETCYKSVLVCVLAEHSHSDSCIVQPVVSEQELPAESDETSGPNQETPAEAGEVSASEQETPVESDEASVSEQKTQATSGEVPTSDRDSQESEEARSEESPPLPTPTPKAEELRVSLSASVASCFAGDTPMITYKVTGGTSPYILTASYRQDSETRNTPAPPTDAAGNFSVSPWTYGTMTVTLTAQDSAGNTASACGYISVATYSGMESDAIWEATLPEVPKGASNAKALLMVAQSQLGYGEVTTNFVTDEGRQKGYSRYGDWYGIPYGDWCAMFVSFCLHYAQIPESVIPLDCACQHWVDTLRSRGMYSEAKNYEPEPGDIVFFSNDGSFAGHVGIVEAVEMTVDGVSRVKTIEGNNGNYVARFEYDISDSHLLGYLPLSASAKQQQNTP